MNNFRITLISCMFLFSSAAHSIDYVWIVGGGPSVDSSQASIELNVKWLVDIFQRNAKDSKLAIYYTDGTDPAPDVVEWHRATESKAALQPLARIYGAQTKNGNSYHSNTVPNVRNGTNMSELKQQLSKTFAKLKFGDRVFFIFNGHGTYNPKDTSKNALRLWGDERFTAQELEALLSTIDPHVPVRLFLPQCFSGGFAPVIYQGAHKDSNLSSYNHCGFMSVPGNKEAEGCTAGVNVGDYRDYTTYFFSALDGRTRLGAALQSNPDLDSNGVVSLREAHFYSLVYGQSTDVPRTTSEDYLEKWQPWYLRWIVSAHEPNNIYGLLARSLGDRIGIRGDWNLLAAKAKHRYKSLQAQLTTINNEQETLKVPIKKIQDKIRSEVENKWPGAINPYTYSYLHFMEHDLDAAQDFITNESEYQGLIKLQNRLFESETDILTINRDLSQLDKLLRLRRIANILETFQRIASDKERAEYEGLVACESSNPW